MRALGLFLAAVFILSALAPSRGHAQARNTPDPCPRPPAGSIVTEPTDLRSQNAVLRVSLTYRQSKQPNGSTRYCYLAEDGSQAPTLRVKPGDLVILSLKNDIASDTHEPAASTAPVKNNPAAQPIMTHAGPMPEACAGGGVMSATATNLHFHGLTVPATCHQDEVLTTSVLPGATPFEYRFRIPANQPPGLYWYHPHMHGFSKVQVLGGASGALIVEGIERANPELAGLPERVFIIRDQDLLNPDAAPSDSSAPTVLLDADGDARNTGDGTGQPAKDLSLNFVPVPYPNYEPAIVPIKTGEKQLFRILNASAITYLNLQILTNSRPQWLPVVALDGVPLTYSGHTGNGILWQSHVGLPPGGRAEFVFRVPESGATLITHSVNTGSGGENDPVRSIAKFVSSLSAPDLHSRLAAAPEPLPPPALPWLGSVTPVRTRKLYFSETLQDPKDPNSPTTFYVTVDGEQPVPFEPTSTVPNLVVHQGDVEDWIIENRSLELHAFHIHQIHFLLVERFDAPANEPFLRDTINIPFWDGKTAKYPSVKLRMDFRAPGIVGTFPYHCHLLEHEDGGMMGLVRVEPAQTTQSAPDRQDKSGRNPHASATAAAERSAGVARWSANQSHQNEKR